jgi:hypothetical protein
MKTSNANISKNRVHRFVGIVVCISPVMPLLTSLASALGETPKQPFAFVGFALGALFIGILNFYLSFVRPRILLRRLGTLEGQPNVSGIPIVGTILALLGGISGFGALGTTLISLVAVLLDTGGAPWFITAILKDASLFDKRKLD